MATSNAGPGVMAPRTDAITVGTGGERRKGDERRHELRLRDTVSDLAVEAEDDAAAREALAVLVRMIRVHNPRGVGER